MSHQVIENRDEWLSWRRAGIGGSDVAAILGLSKWGTAFTVYLDKHGLMPDHAETDRQRLGRRLEPVLAAEFTDRTALHVTGEQLCVTDDEHPWRRVTIDGLAAEVLDPARDEIICPVEFKSYAVVERDGSIRKDVRCQVLYQMAVTGYPQAWVVGMGPFARIEVAHVTLDHPDHRTDQAFIVEEVDRFWHEHVLANEPPQVTGSDADAEALARLYPEHEPGSVVALDELADDLSRYEEIVAMKAALAKLGEAGDLFANRIKQLMGDAEIGTVDGVPVYTLRATERAGFTVAPTTYRTLRKATKKDRGE